MAHKKAMVTVEELINKLSTYPKDSKVVFIDEAVDFLDMRLTRVISSQEVKDLAANSEDPVEKNYFQTVEEFVLEDNPQDLVIISVVS